MQIALHTGAHFSEEERLMKCLLRNKGPFAQQGIAVPGPGKYRKLIKDTLQAMKTSPLAGNARDVLLDAILDEENADRVLFSNAHFFGAPRAVVRAGRLYPAAPELMAQFGRLFPHDDIEMYLAIRNPASFLPAVFKNSPRDDMISFLGVSDPCQIKWSDTISAIREAAPQVRVTVWCNEDAPLIWEQIIQNIAGLEDTEDLVARFDLLREIVSREGMTRFHAYLKSHAKMTTAQKQRVIAAFMEKHAIEDEIEEELDMPGWTDDLIDEMSDIYDEDVFTIQSMPGVTVISPEQD